MPTPLASLLLFDAVLVLNAAWITLGLIVTSRRMRAQKRRGGQE